MTNKNQNTQLAITCGDEGVQLNNGCRLSVVGAGYELPHFSKLVKLVKKLFKQDIAILSSEQNAWYKSKLKLKDWGQVDAAMKQHTEAIADKDGLLYSGFLSFSDPKKLANDIKGHMVRPKGIHIANKISFTLGGGEQVYNLSCFQISADWAHLASKKMLKEIILPQIEFYQTLSPKPLELIYELNGVLGEKIAKKNLESLKKIGIKFKE